MVVVENHVKGTSSAEANQDLSAVSCCYGLPVMAGSRCHMIVKGCSFMHVHHTTRPSKHALHVQSTVFTPLHRHAMQLYSKTCAV